MSKLQDCLKPGDRVALSRAFLHSTGQYIGEAGFRRGVIVEPPHPIKWCVNVAWDDKPDEPTGIMKGNLWPADKLHLELT